MILSCRGVTKAFPGPNKLRRLDVEGLTWLSQAMHWSCVHVSGSTSEGQFVQHISGITSSNNKLAPIRVRRMNELRINVPPVGSALGNKSWPQMLHAATPVMSAAKAKKGAWALSAFMCAYDQYTHNVYQVPGPEVTYTLACRAIEWSRHDRGLKVSQVLQCIALCESRERSTECSREI